MGFNEHRNLDKQSLALYQASEKITWRVLGSLSIIVFDLGTLGFRPDDTKFVLCFLFYRHVGSHFADFRGFTIGRAASSIPLGGGLTQPHTTSKFSFA